MGFLFWELDLGRGLMDSGIRELRAIQESCRLKPSITGFLPEPSGSVIHIGNLWVTRFHSRFFGIVGRTL